SHGRTGMPYTFESVTARADDHRRFLAALRAILQTRQIICKRLQRIDEVIEILDLRDRSQAAQGSANALADDCGLADAGVCYAKFTILFLKSCKPLVYVADLTHILTYGKYGGVAFQRSVKASPQYFSA